MSTRPKGAMHFEGRKSIGAMEAAENQRRWDADHYKTVNKKPLHWYDITRAHLNFEVAKGGKIQKIGTSKPVDERFRERLQELGVTPNPEVKKGSPEYNRMPNQLVEFVFGGDHDTMVMMAFGSQAVDFSRDGTADNKDIYRDKTIEYWALDIYRFLASKYGEENIIGFDVHCDETTPHCHATIIPVVSRTDKKTGKQKQVVSYKGLFGKDKATGQQIMKDLHTELAEQVNSKYGLYRGDPVSKTDEHHKDKVQMYYKMKRELPQMEDEIVRLKIAISKLEMEQRGLYNDINKLNEDLKNGKITLEQYEQRTAELQDKIHVLSNKINERKSTILNYENRISETRHRMVAMQDNLNRTMEVAQTMSKNVADNADTLIKGAVFDDLISGLKPFFERLPGLTAADKEAISGTLIEDLFDGSLAGVLDTAASIVVATIDGTTTPTQSFGGGGGSSDAPKKDDDESWKHFAMRAIRYAHSKKSAIRRGGRRR